jgi:hypothetical protein
MKVDLRTVAALIGLYEGRTVITPKRPPNAALRTREYLSGVLHSLRARSATVRAMSSVTSRDQPSAVLKATTRTGQEYSS